jgi:hypothetical protein
MVQFQLGTFSVSLTDTKSSSSRISIYYPQTQPSGHTRFQEERKELTIIEPDSHYTSSSCFASFTFYIYQLRSRGRQLRNESTPPPLSFHFHPTKFHLCTYIWLHLYLTPNELYLKNRQEKETIGIWIDPTYFFHARMQIHPPQNKTKEKQISM